MNRKEYATTACESFSHGRCAQNLNKNYFENQTMRLSIFRLNFHIDFDRF